MTRYNIEFDGEFDETFRGLMERGNRAPGRVIFDALGFYYGVYRTLEEANIECEPNSPWKLSLTRNVSGVRRVIRDICLP